MINNKPELPGITGGKGKVLFFGTGPGLLEADRQMKRGHRFRVQGCGVHGFETGARAKTQPVRFNAAAESSGKNCRSGLALVTGQTFYRLLATGILRIVAALMNRVASGNGAMNLGDPRAAGHRVSCGCPA
jgi:hypothetical protein